MKTVSTVPRETFVGPGPWTILTGPMQREVTPDADPRHRKILKGLYVNEDRTVEYVTRAVLLNSLSMADGTPMVAALRLKSAADRAVFEETQAQVYQNIKESEARAVSPGGWFDQFMKRLDQGKGPSRS